MGTRKTNKSSIPSLKARKHKPTVSSPLTVTNFIKNSLNLTDSSSSKSPNEEDNLSPDDAHVTPSSSEIHKPMHVASTLPLVDYDHVSTPEWVLHFQKTFREHEQRFAQMDILVDQITYLRTKLHYTIKITVLRTMINIKLTSINIKRRIKTQYIQHNVNCEASSSAKIYMYFNFYYK
ncbi:hypothetical protein BDB01DRAFT_897539 [Pilobolus umbonatus]|nr:hypothetical protein BDB01DRAFT_897539 [Pilobolus umbonatus]